MNTETEFRSPTPISSKFGSPLSPTGSLSDDQSIASSASTLNRKDFTIPETWRPSIMACLKQPTDSERKLELTPETRNEIVRDLVTQMFSYDPEPKAQFAAIVAKKLVKRHPFMKDIGERVSGYVSQLQLTTCTLM